MKKDFGVDYRALGAKVRQKRIMLGLTQEKISEKLDLSESFYSRIERGERILSVETLIKISNYFGLSLDYLLLDSTQSGFSEGLQSELEGIFGGMNPSQTAFLLNLLKVYAENIDRLHVADCGQPLYHSQISQ